METPISFKAGETVLEGLLARLPGEQGVVITHPHSLYGGSMHNPVVETIGRVFRKKGLSTLRFNFRGVGNSLGSFGDGVGEMQDVLAALQFLLDSGISKLQLAGYSFGSRVIAGMRDLPKEVTGQHHIAPPVAFMDYSGIAEIEKLRTVIAGADDDIAPPAKIKELISLWSPDAHLVILEETDHFFSTSLDRLAEELERAILL